MKEKKQKFKTKKSYPRTASPIGPGFSSAQRSSIDLNFTTKSKKPNEELKRLLRSSKRRGEEVLGLTKLTIPFKLRHWQIAGSTGIAKALPFIASWRGRRVFSLVRFFLAEKKK
ncbi:hypothetical protein ACFQZX_03160 [Mucilaginibacter litoreus]|uniref:Uncharacterized protein n=1 Tax=Mucilaginibacter litoreus TaxID=1048221 RepID=A0ABW3AQI1_9SPHI